MNPIDFPELNALLARRDELNRVIELSKEEIKNLRPEIVSTIEDKILSLPIDRARQLINDIYWSDNGLTKVMQGLGKKLFGKFSVTPITTDRLCETCRAPLLAKTLSSLRVINDHNVTGISCESCEEERYERSRAEYAEEHKAGEEQRESLAIMPYSEYLNTEWWQATRQQALRRAKYRCQLCNGNKPLHVHHRTYERRGNELASDLIVLCEDCHATFHETLKVTNG